eukprot:evm.model.scf_3620.1 EVM.evm.TU.scf_3620.1   scf_3620:9911-12475(-)
MGNSASRVGDRGGRLGSLDDELVQRDGREGASAVAALTGAEDYSVWVELRVSCRKLQNRDVTSLSDPMAVLFKRAQTGMWEEVGRTEVVANNLSEWQPLSLHPCVACSDHCNLAEGTNVCCIGHSLVGKHFVRLFLLCS